MRPPKTVKVIGKVYRLEVSDTLDADAGALGITHADKCLINYAKSENPQALRDTILHEVLHAVFAEAGISAELAEIDKELEEKVVRRAATVLLDTMRTSRGFVDFLLAA